jgi:hypothetical protein
MSHNLARADSTGHTGLGHVGSMAPRRPATATRVHLASRPISVVLSLLALYVLALIVPIVEATAARAALADATFVELCTGDGIRRITLDGHGQLVEHAPVGQHAGHDCTSCLTGCPNHGLCGGFQLALVPAWSSLAPVHGGAEAAVAAGPAALAPLPARGPPTLS